MVVLITTTTYLATTRQRVCCVYVEAPIVYVGVCCVYVENTHFPRIYRRFQQNPCMLRQFLYSELEKDRFCMAKPMVLASNTYAFRRQYLRYWNAKS